MANPNVEAESPVEKETPQETETTTNLSTEVSLEETSKFKRFNIFHRLEHWIFMASFTILGITGLVQRYAASPISLTIVTTVGGIENLRIIHRISATVMMLVVIYHIGAVGYRLYVRRTNLNMLPVIADIRSAIQTLAYYFGISKNSPQQGRYTFEEKIEYWAVVWGTVVMAVTGFALWNPVATANFLPGQFIPAAKVAHSMEALLAIVAIIIWHLYHVLVKTFNRSMFTGYLTEEQMHHEHPLELADIKAGIAEHHVAPEKKKKRERIFWPTYGVLAVVLLVFVIWFVTFEDTALATVPPVDIVEVFVPLTPTPLPTPRPTSTPAPIEAVTWDAGVGALFESKCGSCHNSSAMIGGLDLTSYQGVLAGGNSGPAIVAGDPEAGTVITVQIKGDHTGQFTPEELDLIREWIEAGSPEN